jgi:hypothetical protein
MTRQVHRIISLCIIGAFLVCIIAFLLFRALRSSSKFSEDKFVEVYVQLSIANETFALDTLKLKEEKKRIFEQAGVTQKEIDHFVNRYNQKPEEWGRVWKKIGDRLSEESIKEEKKQKPP